jgi:hypothetical protein
MDRVFSDPCQAAKVAARATLKTMVVVSERNAEVVGEVIGQRLPA